MEYNILSERYNVDADGAAGTQKQKVEKLKGLNQMGIYLYNL